MLNKTMLIGNLGGDPEIRHSKSGKPIVNLRLATSESWKDRNTGERKEKVEWHRIVIFSEKLAEIAEKYLKKGSKVYIEGQIQTRKWQDQSGADKYTTEIVVSGFSGVIKMLGEKSPGNYEPAQKAEPQQTELDDEIPF